VTLGELAGMVRRMHMDGTRRRAGLRRAGLLAAAGTMGGMLAMGLAGTAFAGSDAAMNVDVTNATLYVKQQISPGYCAANLVSDVTVVNLTSSRLKIDAIWAQVTINTPNGMNTPVIFTANDPNYPSGTPTATFTNAARSGFAAGDVLGPEGTKTYKRVELSFPAPCTATSGDVAIGVTDKYGSGSGDAPFSFTRSTIPIGAFGAVGASALAAGAFGVVSWRRRRQQQPAGTPAA